MFRFFYANICWTKKFGTIANLATTQDTTITMTMTYFHDLAFRFQDTSWLVTTWPGTP